jgi:hypothetical protein
MGLFGPSLNEKIRRSAATAFPQAEWRSEVDWSTGAQLHKLHGAIKDTHTDEQTMQYAHDVWANLTKQFRLHPDDGRDGLLDIGMTSAGGAEQRTGVNG